MSIQDRSSIRMRLRGSGFALVAFALLFTVLSAAPAPAAAQELAARVWLDRGHDPVLQRGDRVRLFYRASRDAYVAIFHLDTNGTVRMIHPRSPGQGHWVRGGRDYRLNYSTRSHWRVDDDPGVGYFFAIASPTPFDFAAFHYTARHAGGGWDLGQQRRRVYHDPYVAMDDFVATLIPDWQWVPYALDFASYSVGRSYDYPRFLCYECHGFRTFSSWNPYLAACTSFRVVIYNDPYYYPAYRYRGNRVVYVRPPVYRQPRYTFKERARGEDRGPVVQARPAIPTQPPRTVPPRREIDPRRAVPAAPPTRSARPRDEMSPTREAPATRRAPDTRVPGATGGTPSVRPGARPSAGSSARPATPSRTRPSQILPGRAGGGGPIDLRRRGESGRDPTAGSRPGGAAGPVNRAGPVRARPSTGPGARGPASSTTPRSSTGPAGSSPPVRSLPPTRTQPPPRATPPRTGPQGATPRPDARPTAPPRTGPPVSSGSGGGKPPVRPKRPPRTGGGGGGV